MRQRVARKVLASDTSRYRQATLSRAVQVRRRHAWRWGRKLAERELTNETREESRVLSAQLSAIWSENS